MPKRGASSALPTFFGVQLLLVLLAAPRSVRLWPAELAAHREGAQRDMKRDMKWCPAGLETAVRVPASPKEYRVLTVV